MSVLEKHKAMSYGRMVKKLDELEEEVNGP